MKADIVDFIGNSGVYTGFLIKPNIFLFLASYRVFIITLLGDTTKLKNEGLIEIPDQVVEIANKISSDIQEISDTISVLKASGTIKIPIFLGESDSLLSFADNLESLLKTTSSPGDCFDEKTIETIGLLAEKARNIVSDQKELDGYFKELMHIQNFYLQLTPTNGMVN